MAVTQNKEGIYIVFEGLQKSGKSTQVELLPDPLAIKYPNTEIAVTREPGGNTISEAIRKVVQGTKFDIEMFPECEALLYAAARAQSLRTNVRPVVKRGGIVLADRSVDTSRVIQGYVRGMGRRLVDEANAVAVRGCQPNKRFFIDVDPRTCYDRAQKNLDYDDKFESMPLQFFEKSRQGYLELVASDGMELVDGNGTIDEVHGLLLRAVLRCIDDS